jgi:hypothetical protein
VEEFVAEKVPNLKEVMSAAYVKAFQATLGVLVGIVLFALFVASFIPRVQPVRVGQRDAQHTK